MNKQGSIYPAFQSAYDWVFSQSTDEVFIALSFPSTFNIHSLQTKLELDNQLIICSVPNHIPFLHGLLHSKVDSFNVDYNDKSNEVIIHLIKREDDKSVSWDILNKSRDPRNNGIDPKSAFLIFTLLSTKPDNEVSDEIRDNIVQLLTESANAGFVPALITFGNICLKVQSSIQTGLSYLQIAAERYKSPEAFFCIGSQLLRQGDSEQGLQMIQVSLDLGYKHAGLILGRLYSPLYPQIPFAKDAKKALELFEIAGDMPESKYEMAKIYHIGCEGIEKDLKLADELYKEAKSELKDLPPISQNASKGEVEETNSSNWHVPIAAVGILSVFGFLLYNHVRKQKR